MRLSIGTGIVLMAIGGVLAFAVQAPAEVDRYVSVIDVGLILIWTGILVLLTQVWLHRPRRPRRSRVPAYDAYDTDEHDVHHPGYAGETRQLPTIRGGR
jgi:hypothetical protein